MLFCILGPLRLGRLPLTCVQVTGQFIDIGIGSFATLSSIDVVEDGNFIVEFPKIGILTACAT